MGDRVLFRKVPLRQSTSSKKRTQHSEQAISTNAIRRCQRSSLIIQRRTRAAGQSLVRVVLLTTSHLRRVAEDLLRRDRRVRTQRLPSLLVHRNVGQCVEIHSSSSSSSSSSRGNSSRLLSSHQSGHPRRFFTRTSQRHQLKISWTTLLQITTSPMDALRANHSASKPCCFMQRSTTVASIRR